MPTDHRNEPAGPKLEAGRDGLARIERWVGWTIVGFGIVVLIATALLHVLAGLTLAKRTPPSMLFYLGLPTLEVILVGTLLLFRKWVPVFIAVALIDLLNFGLILMGSIGLG